MRFRFLHDYGRKFLSLYDDALDRRATRLAIVGGRMCCWLDDDLVLTGVFPDHSEDLEICLARSADINEQLMEMGAKVPLEESEETRFKGIIQFEDRTIAWNLATCYVLFTAGKAIVRRLEINRNIPLNEEYPQKHLPGSSPTLNTEL